MTIRFESQSPSPRTPDTPPFGEENSSLAPTSSPNKLRQAWNKTKSGFSGARSRTGLTIKNAVTLHPNDAVFLKKAGKAAGIMMLILGFIAVGGLFGHYVGYNTAGHWIGETAHKVGHWFKHTAGPRLHDALMYVPKRAGWKNIAIYGGSGLAVLGAIGGGTYYTLHKRKKSREEDASILWVDTAQVSNNRYSANPFYEGNDPIE